VPPSHIYSIHGSVLTPNGNTNSAMLRFMK
jgi:hypothetical protein